MKKLNIILLLITMLVIGKTTKAQLSIDTTGLMQAYLQSNYIFEGVVISQCTYEDAGNNIYTTNIIQISKIVKGNLTCGTVSVVTLSGTHDGSNLRVDHQIQYNVGVIGMFMCNDLTYPFTECQGTDNIAPLMLTYGEYGSFEYLFDLVNNEVTGFNSQFQTLDEFYVFLQSVGINVITCDASIIEKVKIKSKLKIAINNEIINRKPTLETLEQRNFLNKRIEQNKLFSKQNNKLNKTGETIEYLITRANIVGTGSNSYYDVDISLKSNVSTTYLDGISFRLKYNPQVFGTNITSVITNQLGSSLNSSFYDNIGVFDFNDSIIQVSIFNISFSGTPNRVNLTPSPLKVINIKIPIINCKKFPNLKIDTFPDIDVITMFTLANNTPFGSNLYTFSNYILGAYRQGSICSPDVTSISKDTVAGGIKEQFIIYGDNFGNAKGKVYMTCADARDTQYYALDTYDYTWSNNQITITTPAFADSGYYKGGAYLDGTIGSGYIKIIDSYGNEYFPATTQTEPSKIQVKYVVWNQSKGTGVNRYKNNELLFSANSDGVYHFKLSSNITDMGMINCIKAAFRRYSCSTGIPFVLDNGTVSTTLNSIDSNGINVIQLLNYPTNSSSLATAYIRSSITCSSSSTIAFPTAELDISINNSKVSSFQYDTTGNSDINTGKYDFYAIILHELGHAHLLGHVNNQRDIMYKKINLGPYSSVNRNLNFNGYNFQATDYIKNNSMVSANGISCVFKLPIVPTPINCRNSMVSTNESLINQIDIKVYPNPFENGIQINFNSTLKDKFKVSIYNQLGQVIYSETNDIFIGDNLIKLSDLNLNDGIYYLSINSESFRYTGKIVCVK